MPATSQTLSETIFALSSGAGRAGVAVFRLSGPGVIEAMQALFCKLPIARQTVLRPLQDPETKTLIDEALVFWFKGPHSFTGEDVAEFQIHGSLAVIDKLTSVLLKLGLRPAEPGEFTRLAFRNGKLDLAQTEALGDLIDAETDKQRAQALGQFGGNLSSVAEDWRTKLIGCLAPLEAAIDFPDEGDIPEDIERRAAPVISALQEELKGFLVRANKAQRIRKGVSIVLLGPPNAGKSSLLNWLADSDVAIVSDTPGTTRDLIETRIDLAGVPVSITDTAGLRTQTHDTIEQEGIRRARAKAKNADLRIGLIGWDQQEEASDITSLLEAEDMFVLNKADISGDNTAHKDAFAISLKTQQGLDEFLKTLEARIVALCGTADEPALTRARHVHAVTTASQALARAHDMLQQAPELAAEDVRASIHALGQITGAIGVEEILGEIFSSFCVGK